MQSTQDFYLSPTEPMDNQEQAIIVQYEDDPIPSLRQEMHEIHDALDQDYSFWKHHATTVESELSLVSKTKHKKRNKLIRCVHKASRLIMVAILA